MKTLMLLLLIGSPAIADDLVYQSQTLAGTQTTIDGPSTTTSPSNDVYTVTVTISGPLAPNLNMAMIAPQAWTVTCQSCMAPLSSSPTGIGATVTATSAVFMFSTDATGKITSWNFAINGTFELPDGEGGFISQGNGSFISGDGAQSQDIQDAHEYKQVNAGPKGTWTQSSLSNPTPTPPVDVLARTCSSSWAPATNAMSGGVSQAASGAGMFCGHPMNYPGAWYLKVTTDGGKTFTFVTLASLGLGNGK